MARQWFKRIQRGRGRVRFNRATSRIGNVIGGTMQKIQYPNNRTRRSIGVYIGGSRESSRISLYRRR